MNALVQNARLTHRTILGLVLGGIILGLTPTRSDDYERAFEEIDQLQNLQGRLDTLYPTSEFETNQPILPQLDIRESTLAPSVPAENSDFQLVLDTLFQDSLISKIQLPTPPRNQTLNRWYDYLQSQHISVSFPHPDSGSSAIRDTTEVYCGQCAIAQMYVSNRDDSYVVDFNLRGPDSVWSFIYGVEFEGDSSREIPSMTVLDFLQQYHPRLINDLSEDLDGRVVLLPGLRQIWNEVGQRNVASARGLVDARLIETQPAVEVIGIGVGRTVALFVVPGAVVLLLLHLLVVLRKLDAVLGDEGHDASPPDEVWTPLYSDPLSRYLAVLSILIGPVGSLVLVAIRAGGSAGVIAQVIVWALVATTAVCAKKCLDQILEIRESSSRAGPGMAF